MLSLVLGTSGVERAKSIAVLVLAVLLGMSMWQVSSLRAAGSQSREDRTAATAVSRQFALALTTYDYTHIDVYVRDVAAFSSDAIQQRVAAASEDLVAARASSLGDVQSTVVVAITSIGADVLASTSQVISGEYAGQGTRVTGLLDMRVSRQTHGWIVTDFRWLIAPTN